MRRCVVARDALAPCFINHQMALVTNLERTIFDLHLMEEDARGRLLHIYDLAYAGPRDVLDPSDVSDLATGLCVERCAIEGEG